MIDLGPGILEVFAEAQQRFGEWMPKRQHQTRGTMVLIHRRRGRILVRHCTSCGRRGHDARSCLHLEDWNG